MTCAKCGGHNFFLDAEDGPVCWACRKPANQPQPAGRSRAKAETMTWADRRRAVELSDHIGVLAAAREFGVAESTIYDWRSALQQAP